MGWDNTKLEALSIGNVDLSSKTPKVVAAVIAENKPLRGIFRKNIKKKLTLKWCFWSGSVGRFAQFESSQYKVVSRFF